MNFSDETALEQLRTRALDGDDEAFEVYADYCQEKWLTVPTVRDQLQPVIIRVWVNPEFLRGLWIALFPWLPSIDPHGRYSEYFVESASAVDGDTTGQASVRLMDRERTRPAPPEVVQVALAHLQKYGWPRLVPKRKFTQQMQARRRVRIERRWPERFNW